MNIPTIHPKKRARIEIIPLIDIMFFLLATFAMVSLSMVKNRGIPVILPAAGTSAAQEHKDHVVVSITETGQLYLDKRELAQEQLIAELRKLKEQNAELRVFINGDENARLGLAIGVLDDARKLGITKVAFQTRPMKRGIHFSAEGVQQSERNAEEVCCLPLRASRSTSRSLRSDPAVGSP